MIVYVLTLYDPAAQYGYTEVFYTFDAAIRYTGLTGWKKRGNVWTWASTTEEVTVSRKKDCFSFRHDSEIYKIRKKRVRGRKP